MCFELKPECTIDACSPTTVEAQPSFLTEFPRTFTWEVKAPQKTVVALDILGEGLAKSSQPCPGERQYSVAHSKADSGGGGTRYCKGGSVTRLDLADQAVVTLQVQPEAPVSVLFQTSAGPLSKLCSRCIDQKQKVEFVYSNTCHLTKYLRVCHILSPPYVSLFFTS